MADSELKVLSSVRTILSDSREGPEQRAHQMLAVLHIIFGLLLHQLKDLTYLLIATHFNKQALSGDNEWHDWCYIM